MEEAVRSATASPPPPRVNVALRWREPRALADDCETVGISEASSLGNKEPPQKLTRLCVLRDMSGQPGGYPTATWGRLHTDATRRESKARIVAFGMFAPASTPPPYVLRPPPRKIEAAVHSQHISIEGLAAGATQGDASLHPTQLRPPYSDAGLTDELAETIAAELTRAFPRPSSEAPLYEGRGNEQRCSPREVLTFPMGIQGGGKTSFLLGSAQHWDEAVDSQRSSSPDISLSGGLFRAVLDRVFRRMSGDGDACVAMSVVEVRDAVPLLHPSVLRRPRETTDLLSGQLLGLQQGEGRNEDEHDSTPSGVRAEDHGRHIRSSSSSSSFFASASSSSLSSSAVDRPTDIPAACYVRVRSPAEATHVLYAALLSSVSWQPFARTDSTNNTTGWAGPAPSAPPPVSLLMRPAGQPHEEKASHVCITLLVGHTGASNRGGDGDASAAPAVGIWKLWDLAGPSPTCGYRPRSSSGGADESAYSTPQRKRRSQGAKRSRTEGFAQDPMGRALQPVVPWSNRYSLPSLTHTCLTAFSCQLQQPSVPDMSLLHCDATALQIATSAMASCSLVTPVVTVVADAAADGVNAEVLRSASGWAQHSWRSEGARRGDGADDDSAVEGRMRRCGEENAMAAQRVLESYAVPFAEFMGGCFSFTSPGGPSSAAAEGLPRNGNANADGGAGSFLPGNAWRALDGSRSQSSTTQNVLVQPKTTQESGCTKALAADAVDTEGARATTAPLSINATASEEDRIAALHTFAGSVVAPSSPVEGVMRRAAAEDVLEERSALGDGRDASASQAAPPHPGELSGNLAHTPQRTHPERLSPADALANVHTTPANISMSTATANVAVAVLSPWKERLTVAAVCAAGAVEAEEARLRRFQGLFGTESLSAVDGPSWTLHDADALSGAVGASVERPALTDGGTTGAAGSEEASPSREKRGQPHTPVKREGSPPFVTCTGVRDRPSSEPPSASSGVPQPPQTRPLNDKDEAFACLPQRLHPDACELLSEQGGRSSEGARLINDSVTSRERDAQNAGLDTSAAVVHFLTPYCAQFTALYTEMREEVAAWKATEAASLRALSELVEQHTRDVEQLAQLLRRTSAQQQKLSSAAPDGIAVSSAPPAASDSSSSALAATGSLIFEQLVKSEEKVTWLEKQLIQWRQRTREASALLQCSNLQEGGASGAAGHVDSDTGGDFAGVADGDQRPHVWSALAGEGRGVRVGDASDPTRRCVAQAQRILQRLLQRCGRAYASAQRCNTRWQTQLSQEQAARSALMEHVAELAAYRRRGPGVAMRSPLRSSPEKAENAVLQNGSPPGVPPSTAKGCPGSGHFQPDPSCPPSHDHQRSSVHTRDVAEKTTATSTTMRAINVSNRELEMTAAALDSGRYTPMSSATPAPVSPIRSPNCTALSLPSRNDDLPPCSHASSLRGTPVFVKRDPRLSPSPSLAASPAEVASRLAALLSRAVGSSERGRDAPSRGRSRPPGAGAGLFDVHVGPASAAPGDETAMCNADGGDEDAAKGRGAAPLSRVAWSLSPSLTSSVPLRALCEQSNARHEGTVPCPSAVGDCGAAASGEHHHQVTPRSSSLQWRERWRLVPATSSEPQESTRMGFVVSHKARVEKGKTRTSVAGGAPRRTGLARGPPLGQETHPGAAPCDDDAYPATALQRLRDAAAHLAASAAQLASLGSTKRDGEGSTVGRGAQLLRQALKENEGRRSSEAASGWGSGTFTECEKGRQTPSNDEGESLLSTPLYQSMEQLRSASQAVQREAREAAERERAYLSAILFSADSTAHR